MVSDGPSIGPGPSLPTVAAACRIARQPACVRPRCRGRTVGDMEAPRSRSHLARRAGAPAGLTVIEATISLVVLALLLFGAYQLLAGMRVAAAQDVAAAQASRAVTTAVRQLGADLDAARPCSPSRFSSALHSYSPTMLALWSDVDDDGNTDLVVWQVVDQTLRRGVSFGTAPDADGQVDCSHPVPPSGDLLVPRVRTVDSVFTLYAGAVAQPASATCASVGQQVCAQVDRVWLHVQASAGASGLVDRVEVLELAAWSRLA